MNQDSIVKVFTAFDKAMTCVRLESTLNIVFEGNMNELNKEELEYFSDICLLLPIRWLKKTNLRNKKLGQMKPYQVAAGVFTSCLTQLNLTVSTTSDIKEFVDYILGMNNENKEAAMKVAMAWVIDWQGIVLSNPDYSKLLYEYTRYYAVNSKFLQREYYIDLQAYSK